MIGIDGEFFSRSLLASGRTQVTQTETSLRDLYVFQIARVYIDTLYELAVYDGRLSLFLRHFVFHRAILFANFQSHGTHRNIDAIIIGNDVLCEFMRWPVDSLADSIDDQGFRRRQNAILNFAQHIRFVLR